MINSFIIIPIPISLSEFLLIALIVLLIFGIRRIPGIMEQTDKKKNNPEEDTYNERK